MEKDYHTARIEELYSSFSVHVWQGDKPVKAEWLTDYDAALLRNDELEKEYPASKYRVELQCHV